MSSAGLGVLGQTLRFRDANVASGMQHSLVVTHNHPASRQNTDKLFGAQQLAVLTEMVQWQVGTST